MSMELHVFSDRRLETTAEWQQAIDKEGFPLRLSEESDLTTVRDLLPVHLRDVLDGFECFHDESNETMVFLGEENFDHPWTFALGFRWLGSNLNELLAAWMAATAYAAATQGVIFDHEEGKVLSPQQARQTVQNIERDIPRLEAMLADIKAKYSQRPS